MECSVVGCDREVHAKNICEMHYRRLIRKGSIGEAWAKREQRRFPEGSEEDRFLSFIKRNGDCWEWLGATTTGGYAQFQSNKKTRYAHRWSYEHYKGPIPVGMTIDHLCRNRGCVNPKHLEIVTNKENILRGIAPSAINNRKTHCVHGHELSENRKCYVCARERDRKRWPLIKEKRRLKKCAK